jgi:hypothetical protein
MSLPWEADGIPSLKSSSQMTAVTWADGLTIGGFTDWRLPTALNQDGSGPDSGREDGSEMSHLFYNELGGTAQALRIQFIPKAVGFSFSIMTALHGVIRTTILAQWQFMMVMLPIQSQNQQQLSCSASV